MMKTTNIKLYNLATALTVIAASVCITHTAYSAPVSTGAHPSLVASADAPAVPDTTVTNHRGTDVSLDFVAADINDVIKALAVQTGANIVSSTDVKGAVTVSLSHVTLEQALDAITHLSGYAYTKTGNTYLVGTPVAIAAINPPPVANVKPPVTDVAVFLYANSDDLTAMLHNRYPDLKVSSGTAISGSKAGTGAKAIVLTGDADTVAQAQAAIAQLEDQIRKQAEEAQTTVYTVHYASLTDLINILNTLVPSLIVTPGPGQGFGSKAPTAAATAASSGSSGTATAPSGSSGGSATGASQASATGPVALLLTGSEVNIARGLDILNKVDVRPVQILYEAKVTELTNNAQHNIGLNWDFSGAQTTIGEIYPGNTQTPVTTPPAVTYPGKIFKFGTFGRSSIPNLATVSLDAMFQDGDAKLLADPNIAAVDGQPAQVFIGNTINYVQSITQTPTGQNVTTASVQVGVILRVTGKITSDGYITLNIHPEVSSITQFLPVPGGGSLPEVATRFADTTVRVKDGDTVAIGGLIQENDLLTVTKVPFFGDIPVFGKLFQDSKKNKTRDEVVFFLKTSVMKG